MWDLFISHASEDKDVVVRPLANRLTKMGLAVWYDEHTIKLGDSLREKIDEGLAKSTFGIIVLSPNFMPKFWPNHELDALFMRETSGGKVILPLWHKVTKDDVLNWSPLIASKYAARWEKGLDEVVREILAVVSPIPDKPSEPTDQNTFGPPNELIELPEESLSPLPISPPSVPEIRLVARAREADAAKCEAGAPAREAIAASDQVSAAPHEASVAKSAPQEMDARSKAEIARQDRPLPSILFLVLLCIIFFALIVPWQPRQSDQFDPKTPPVVIETPIKLPIQKPLLIIVDSITRRGVREQMKELLRQIPNLEVKDDPQDLNWIAQSLEIANEKPRILLVHWHTLRDIYSPSAQSDRHSEEDLLLGMEQICRLSPRTTFIIYSSAFSKQWEADARKAINWAIHRIEDAPVSGATAFVDGLKILPWSTQPTTFERAKLIAVVQEALNSRTSYAESLGTETSHCIHFGEDAKIPWLSKARTEQERFHFDENGTVLDQKYSLRWTIKDSQTPRDYSYAMRYCASKGRGWHVPTIKEYSFINTAPTYVDEIGTIEPAACAGGYIGCWVPPFFQLSGADFWVAGTSPTDAPHQVKLWSAFSMNTVYPGQELLTLCVKEDFGR